MHAIRPKILILGSTGFVGHAWMKELEKIQIRVRCLVRNPEKMSKRTAYVEVVKGDLLEPDTVIPALEGIETIFYLVHALIEKSENFEKIEVQQAEGIAKFVSKEQRIIYLSGLGHGDLSPHLRSRQHVGEVLAKGKAQVIELRASIIIGEGSLSFELIRALVQRLPFIVTAPWSKVASQPLALSDLLLCFKKVLELKRKTHHMIIEIGGKDQVLYEDLLKTYAKIVGLTRPVLDIPNLSKKLTEESLKIIAPEFADVGSKLLDSIEIPSVVQTNDMENLLQISPMGIEASMRCCLNNYFQETDEEQYQLLKKLKDNRNFSQFLKGSEFIEVFDLPIIRDIPLDLAALVDMIRGPLRLIPGGIKLTGWDLQYADGRLSAHFNFILTGAFRIQLFHPENDPSILRFVIGFRPKFFYESAQWLVYTQISKFILDQLERRLSIKK